MLRLTLVFCVSSDSKGVGSKRGLDFGVVEMQDLTVLFDHINLKPAIVAITTK
jgi:hypothetical protein